MGVLKPTAVVAAELSLEGARHEATAPGTTGSTDQRQS